MFTGATPYELFTTKLVGSKAVFSKLSPFTVPIPTLKGLGSVPDTACTPAPNSNSKVDVVVNLETNRLFTYCLSII